MTSLVKDNDTSNLIRGSSIAIAKDKPFTDPLKHVERSQQHRTKSVSELVKSAGQVCEAIDAARNEPDILKRVMSKLVEIKMISTFEAGKTDIAGMSTISKYRKIHEHREVFLHADVANKLCSGITILYELGLLIDNLPDDGDAADQLIKHLASLDGPLTRRWTQELRETIAPKKRRATKPIVAHTVEESASDTQVSEVHIIEQADTTDNDTPVESVKKSSDNIPLSNRVSVVVSQPSRRAERISVLYATPNKDSALSIAAADGKCRCLVLGNEIAEDANLFVQGSSHVVLSMGTVVNRWGFNRCTGVYSLARFAEADITGSEILAVYQRGASELEFDTADTPNEGDAIGWIKSLVGEAEGRHIHVFADCPSEEWEAIVGEDNWSTES